MKCQIRDCLKEATHATCYGRTITGFFCREHCFSLVSSNWGAMIERSIKGTNGRTLKDFSPR